MAKASPKEKSAKNPGQKRHLRSSGSKYLKPGTLAQVRYSRASNSKPCVDIRKIPVGIAGCRKKDERVVESSGVDKGKSPLMLSPVNLIRQSSFVGTPKTPQPDVFASESRLESLPMDLLVMILCYLQHDQLKPVFHVSQRLRKAVLRAWKEHFNYTTPNCYRRDMLNTMTPRPTNHYPSVRGGSNGFQISNPPTPKAPRQGLRPPSRLTRTEMRQVAGVLLFSESVLLPRCRVPSVLAKPVCKPVASNRVLFYEDELCQAVAQNKLR